MSKPDLRCDKCNKQLKYPKSFINHSQVCSKSNVKIIIKKAFKCKFCKKEFSKAGWHKRHIDNCPSKFSNLDPKLINYDTI